MVYHAVGPLLTEKVQKEIEAEQKRIHDEYWPQVSALAVGEHMLIALRIGISSSPPPILEPKKLLRVLGSYARDLFEAAAKRYSRDSQLENWLKLRGQEVFDTLTGRLRFAQNLSYHASEEDMNRAVMESLRLRVNAHLATLGAVPLSETPSGSPPQATTIVKRLPSTITSPRAARKLDDYLAANGIGLTDFASRAQITDRTLRSFRKTGKVRRNLFAGIARAMGTTKEELLK